MRESLVFSISEFCLTIPKKKTIWKEDGQNDGETKKN